MPSADAPKRCTASYVSQPSAACNAMNTPSSRRGAMPFDRARAVPGVAIELLRKLDEKVAARETNGRASWNQPALHMEHYCFVMVKPVTVASVLCAKRMPNTPSVDFSLPAATTSALG